MKNKIKISLLTLSFIFSGVLFANFSYAETGTCLSTFKNNSLMTESNQFSWNAESGAVNYKVEIKNTATQETTIIDTTGTSISLLGLPIGTYSITVTAEFADGSSTIIIEDVIVV